MATIHINSREYEVDGADSLLETCLSLGLGIPYFCWYPALGSVGTCRQCTVKQCQSAEDTRGRLVMSCMIPASDGTFISTDDEEVRQFRESAVEWLMTNRPHDCPICEEGGNCHLQDITAMTEHSFRHYRLTKRTHRNQGLGPFISREMGRYIACYRCVRYYKDYADGTNLGIHDAHDSVYFGRPEDDTPKSEFSGSLVKICPTGVFTDKAHSERYNRKWDMQFAPNIYQQCPIGCSINPGERYDELRRIENYYNDTVNHYFLYGHGRFGYGYVSLKDCPRQPVQRRGGDFIALNAEQAVQGVVDILRQLKKVIGISSPRASVESNSALHELIGEGNFYIDIIHDEQKHLQLALKILREGGIYTPTLREIESYDAVLVLGEDVTQTDARVALAVRRAVRGKAREMVTAQKVADWQIAVILNIGQRARHPLFATSVDDTRLDDITAWTYHAPVEDQARLGSAIAHTLDNSAPAVDNVEPELQSKIGVIMQALAGAKKSLIIFGTNTGGAEVTQAAADVAKALKGHGADVGITMIARSVNSMGLGIMGGRSLEEALTELETGRVDTVVVLENDLYHRTSTTRVDAALAKAPLVMVISHRRIAIMEDTHLVLSATSFAESDGTIINNEGRARHFFQIYDPTYYDSQTVMLEGQCWLHSLHSTLLSCEVGWTQLDHVIDVIVTKIPELAGIEDTAPDTTFRIYGQKLAREPHRYSGRTTMRVNISVHEPRQPQDIDTMSTFSMEGSNQPTAHRSQVPFAWAPDRNPPQAWSRFQDEVGDKLRFSDPDVRLFETSENSLDYPTSVPARLQLQDGGWRITPYYHLFSSDGLSQRAPVFQSHVPQPYVKLNPADAAKLGVNAGTRIFLGHDDNIVALPVETSEGLTTGQVGLPVGMFGIVPVLAGVHLEDLKGTRQ